VKTIRFASGENASSPSGAKAWPSEPAQPRAIRVDDVQRKGVGRMTDGRLEVREDDLLAVWRPAPEYGASSVKLVSGCGLLPSAFIR
jgi:hypothetical protein